MGELAATHDRVVIGAGALSHALADALGASRTAAGAPISEGARGVVVVVDDAPSSSEPIAAMSLDRWHRHVDASIASTLAVLCDARAAMPGGGRIVVVVPNLGVTGAPGLVSYTTAVEGIRAMTKSAARQWASEGICLNMIAVPVAAVVPALASVDAHVTAPALGAGVDLLATITSAVAVLLGPDLEHLAGSTLMIDGGSVMLP